MTFRMKNKPMMTLGVATLATLGLQGCATSDGPSESTLVNSQQKVTFPDADSAWVENGTYVNVTNVRKMQEGLTKDQVRDLLGSPHFDEGLFGVREWNYIFHLPDGNGGFRMCQYQVHFDQDMLTHAMHWNNAVCADLLKPRSSGPTLVTLSSDTLFDFDRHELSGEGERALSELAEKVKSELSSVEMVIEGHTDRLGANAYNMQLSERRAQAVRQYLVDSGILGASMTIRGYGESRPAVSCPGESVNAALKACLQPNRRVEVLIRGFED